MGFSTKSPGMQDQAKLCQIWPAKAAELGVPTPQEAWHGAGGYLVSSSATLH